MPTSELELLPPPAAQNRQLFGACPDLVREMTELSADPNGLHGQRPPNLGITHEKPEHRLVLFLKLQGLSNGEVAERSGYTEPWVSQITRQPWFQRRLLEELKLSGRSQMTEYLKVQVTDSFVKLAELRDNAKSETVQAACAMNFIDRVLGKPVQRSEVTMETTHRVDKVETLSAAIIDLEAKEKELTEKLQRYGN